ncbi:DUF1361 domain-containing protein [Atopobacter sp. AH10]|uniref:DUF1361 domain-containing protein n=1 Tax=Atopobacter sp. AH10 TaxID=2315861 RepID=UPI000EF1ACCF|nr:DUF1361 domain-containing protein [Atopobacter sp. AH10]RLK62880.1 DUF1361 domain-containing protein [Atopobacter sp. AH10]
MIGRRILMAYMLLLTVGILWIGYSTGVSQRYLIWNLFLAFMPYLLARLATSDRFSGWHKGAFFFAWLAFYPNAFYLVTDLIHLQNDVFYYTDQAGKIVYVTSPLIWSRLLVLVSAVFIGMMLSYYSLNTVHEWFFKRVKSLLASLTFLTAVSMLTGWAVTLGRFFRFNSWDLLLEPHRFLAMIQKIFLAPYFQLSLMFACVHFFVIFFIWLMDKELVPDKVAK